MEGMFLDAILQHVFFLANAEIRCQYNFANNWILHQLQLQLNDGEQTWDGIGT
jgi:hypothetical protein